ncbi:hypothetical protein MTR67_012238 [Solanum verrucosum]|uniref:Tf2-1-like SH3-like domain-containing protein n=1 Tax=Solanum verrucosum TaxID=315347 RepID=A0AAF0Q9C5_SOLVR|nr:hypothetical protein MTR67_012238 [Solanum verrucosum]
MKGVMRLGKKGKLSPRFVGPYEILRRVRKVAYELDFPNELVSVHPIFYVSILKKCVGDPTSIVPLEGLGVDENFSYEEVSVEILHRLEMKFLLGCVHLDEMQACWAASIEFLLP